MRVGGNAISCAATRNRRNEGPKSGRPAARPEDPRRDPRGDGLGASQTPESTLTVTSTAASCWFGIRAIRNIVTMHCVALTMFCL